MQTIWYFLVAAMLIAYVVLDGFDIGAGIIHYLVARTEEDRASVIGSIGPVWDGNEVWLIAGGGTLFFAFPLLYASAFSGFYLPLTIVLWLLIFRGVGIELRKHVPVPIWQDFFDACFVFGSALLAVFFGAALANVIRGVPLGPDHFFFLSLWTDWNVGPNPGILDWYTVIGGIVAVIALTIHGALWVALKTENGLHERSRLLAVRALPALALLTVISLAATMKVRPSTLDNYMRYPILFVIPAGVVAALGAIYFFSRQGESRAAFLASAAYLWLMLLGAAVGLYPALLPSTLNRTYDITIYNAASGPYALSIGLIWWGFGIALAIAYFILVYRMFSGKIQPAPSGYGE
jgi:cytochrome d ubiquinol oxidase subunit II